MPVTTSSIRTVGAWALMLFWVFATAFAFWWFAGRDLQLFAPIQANTLTPGQASVYFNAADIESEINNLIDEKFPLAEADKPVATVVHFWNPDCSCNKFNDLHVQDLLTKYGALGVRFVVLAHPAAGGSERAVRERIEETFGQALPVIVQTAALGAVSPPSSPATAVFDPDGLLAYFGPYSIGAACTSGSGAFVESVLESLLKNQNPRQMNVSAFGCFCNWKSA